MKTTKRNNIFLKNLLKFLSINFKVLSLPSTLFFFLPLNPNFVFSHGFLATSLSAWRRETKKQRIKIGIHSNSQLLLSCVN